MFITEIDLTYHCNKIGGYELSDFLKLGYL